MLRLFGGFLREHTRSSDIACRYGGEEFTVIFIDASLEETLKRAEELRTGVKRLQPQYNNQLLGTITLSIGIAVRPDHGIASEELLRGADSALYRAKEGGRDRVEAAGKGKE